jgi:dTDP-4-amino-4,6-dideoxygalactose transaminase
LHLALEAVGVRRGDLVLVPTMTLAATAEVVRYFDAVPVFVDWIRITASASTWPRRRGPSSASQRANRSPAFILPTVRCARIIPMHYAGQMADVDAVRALAGGPCAPELIEDAAHTLPAFTRRDAAAPWRAVGTTAEITCFSFYANKCIATGEGGMAVTDNDAYAERMRLMSLHGMSKDAWKRYTATGSWYYGIVAPGFKYNLTDLASAIGRAQLARADELWQARRRVVADYQAALADIPGLVLPIEQPDRKHSWHLYYESASTSTSGGRVATTSWTASAARHRSVRALAAAPHAAVLPRHVQHPAGRASGRRRTVATAGVVAAVSWHDPRGRRGGRGRESGRWHERGADTLRLGRDNLPGIRRAPHASVSRQRNHQGWGPRPCGATTRGSSTARTMRP